MVGEPRSFNQEFNFAYSQNILILRNDERLNKYSSQFMCSIINNYLVSGGYGYGYPVGLSRVKRSKLLVPVDDDNNPDWQFMEDYIKQERQKQVNKVVEYCRSRAIEMPKEMNAVVFKEFWLDDIVDMKSGVRLTKSNQEKGKRPFIGATDSNNGITNFVDNTNKSLHMNVLGVNYNGSGTMSRKRRT